jgi:hypothetical protein
MYNLICGFRQLETVLEHVEPIEIIEDEFEMSLFLRVNGMEPHVDTK